LKFVLIGDGHVILREVSLDSSLQYSILAASLQ